LREGGAKKEIKRGGRETRSEKNFFSCVCEVSTHAHERVSNRYARVQGRSGDVLHPYDGYVASGQAYLTLNLELDIRVDLQRIFILFLSEN